MRFNNLFEGANQEGGEMKYKIDTDKLARGIWSSMKPRIEDAPNWENIDKESREVFIEQAEHLVKTKDKWLTSELEKVKKERDEWKRMFEQEKQWKEEIEQSYEGLEQRYVVEAQDNMYMREYWINPDDIDWDFLTKIIDMDKKWSPDLLLTLFINYISPSKNVQYLKNKAGGE